MKKSCTNSAVENWEQKVDIPLLVIALASVPLFLLEEVENGAIAFWAIVANWVIVGIFAGDLGYRVWLVPNQRLRYLKRHWRTQANRRAEVPSGIIVEEPTRPEGGQW